MALIRLKEEEWAEIEPLIPKQKRGRPRTRNKECFEAILYVLKTGCQWEFLPDGYPPKSTVNKRFLVWHKAGFFRRLFSKSRSPKVTNALYHLDSTVRIAKRGPIDFKSGQIQMH